MEQFRAGRDPSVADYLAANPELGEELREVLETLAFVEGKKKASKAAKVAPAQSAPRRSLGEFELLERIGQGGMGVVYRAVQKSLDRVVALKVVPDAMLDDELAVRRFELEARAAAQLQHPNIVPVYDVGEVDGVVYFTMQLVDGCGLDVVVKGLREFRAAHAKDSAGVAISRLRLADGIPQQRKTPAKGNSSSTPLSSSRSHTSAARRDDYYGEVAALGSDIADAIAHSHERGIIHRDLKPSNLLLDLSGKVWVSDFGLAKTDDSDLTRTGDVVGTLRFMAPERLEGLCDRRSDIYSLGMTLYEILSLRPAFSAASQVKVLDSIRYHAPPRLQQLDPRIPRDLQTIIEKSIAKEPNQRYQTANEFADDLRAFNGGLPIRARRVGSLERMLSWSRRNRALSAALSAVVCSLILVMIGSIYAAMTFRAMAIEQSDLREEASAAEAAATAAANQAQWASEENRRHLYAAEMQLAFDATVSPTGTSRVHELLSHWVPQEGDLRPKPSFESADLRGFEWYWLDALSHPSSRTVLEAGEPYHTAKIAYHPSEPILCFANIDQVMVVNVNEDRLLASHQTIEPIHHVTFSADGTQIVLTTDKGDLSVIDWRLGRKAFSRQLPHALSTVWMPASGDRQEQILVIGSPMVSDVSCYLELLDPQTGATLDKLICGERLDAVRFTPVAELSPDKMQLAVATMKGSLSGVTVYDVNTWGVVYQQLSESHPLSAVAWDSSGSRIAAASNDRRVRIHDLSKPDFDREQIFESSVMSLDWGRNDRSIIVGCYQGSVRMLDPVTLEEQQHLLGPTLWVRWLHYDQQTNKLLTFSVDRGVVEWDLEQSSTQYFQHGAPTITHPTCQIFWSPNGDYLLYSIDTNTQVYARQEKRLIETGVFPESIAGEAIGWFDANLFVTHYRGILSVWNLSEQRVVETIDMSPLSEGEDLRPLQILPDKSIFSVRSRNFRTWTLGAFREGDVTWKPLLPTQEGYYWSGRRLSPDGQKVVVGSLDRCYLVDLAAGTSRECEPTYEQYLDSDWRPDGKFFAACTRQRGIYVYNAESLAIVARLNAHMAEVASLSWSPDGERLASCSDDRTIALWNTARQELVLRIEYPSPVRAVCWSPDGSQLAVLGTDGKAAILTGEASRAMTSRATVSGE